MSSAGTQLLQAAGRIFLLQAQDKCCPICSGPIDHQIRQSHGHFSPTIDHVWPRHKGKAETNRLGNILMVHAICNTRKGSRPPNGCELLILFCVNRRLGLPEAQTAKFDSPWDCS